MQKRKLAVIMDPPESLHYKKDSTIAMLQEAQKRQYDIFYILQQDVFFLRGNVYADCHALHITDDPVSWFARGDTLTLPLTALDIILVRKDPPFDLEYLAMTHLLDHAVGRGVCVMNAPQALRDANEKLFATLFPQCYPATLVTRSIEKLRTFLREEKDIVCKPLDGMGGVSVFRLKYPDENASVVFEMLTVNQTRMMMAQRYLPEIAAGDKRILMVDGEPVAHVLARIPAEGELRGNLAAGGRGVAQLLSERDRWIANEVGPVLRAKGIYFAGLDVIGDWLTEINVTSPTCIREIDAQTGSNISAQFFDCIEKKLG